jgi:hypothetical protein
LQVFASNTLVGQQLGLCRAIDFPPYETQDFSALLARAPAACYASAQDDLHDNVGGEKARSERRGHMT